MADTSKNIKNEAQDPRILDIDVNNMGNALGCATTAQLKACMRVAAATNITLMIVGAPGVGKTALTTEAAIKYCGEPPVCIVAGQLEPTDVTGVPFVLPGTECTSYMPPAWQKKICDGNKHVLFFDEFSNAPRATQSALLKIIGERRFANGDAVPDDVAIVCAMNPEDSAVDYTPIAAPMANRMMFVSYMPTAKEVIDGLTGGWYTKDEYASLTKNERYWRSTVGEFLDGNRQFVHREKTIAKTAQATSVWNSEADSSEKEVMATAWCSPRSWDNVCKALGVLEINYRELTPIQHRIVAGLVGYEAATALGDFIHSRKMIDVDTVIDDPSVIDWSLADGTQTLNDVTEIAQSVAYKLSKCTPDGDDEHVSGLDALEFFEKTVEKDEAGNYKLPGAAAIFTQYITGRGICHGIKNCCPHGYNPREFSDRFIDLMVAYKDAGTLKGTDRGTSVAKRGAKAKVKIA